MTDFSPFERLLAGHAGHTEDCHHDRWVRAQRLFGDRAYREATVLLKELVSDPQTDDFGHGLIDVRLLLARALFHSAQLNGALETAEALLVDEPGEAYAHLIAGRSLQRLNRRDEAVRPLKLAGGTRRLPGPSLGRTANAHRPDLVTRSGLCEEFAQRCWSLLYGLVIRTFLSPKSQVTAWASTLTILPRP